MGNCKGLIYGEDDDYGEAGIITHIMNVEEIANAMIYVARNPKHAKRMGEIGYRRLLRKYKIEDMKATYEGIYKAAGEKQGLPWNTEPFEVQKRAAKKKLRKIRIRWKRG